MEYAVLFIILLLLSGFFSSSETAFLSLQRIKLASYVREKRTGAEAVSALLDTPARLLSAILIGNNLVNTGAAIVGGIIAQRLVSGGAGALLAALVVTVFLVVFGEVGPKTVALHHSFRLSALYAVPMRLWTRLMQPLGGALELVSKAVITLTGGEQESATTMSEAELRFMIGLGAEMGAVPEREALLLHRVFDFGERRVHEVMVPRTEVVWVAKGTSVRDFRAVFAEAPHSRFPMFDEDPDHVVGIVGIKEVMRASAKGELADEDPVEKIARPAYFVPETRGIFDLFREMQSLGHQMAVAIDEWGGTAGIVTIELLLEEVVGQVRDELRPAKPEIRALDAETVQVSGSLSIEEAREELGLALEEGPYDTIAGFVLSRLGHIPHPGESVIVGEHLLTVGEMRGLKIETLQITHAAE